MQSNPNQKKSKIVAYTCICQNWLTFTSFIQSSAFPENMATSFARNSSILLRNTNNFKTIPVFQTSFKQITTINRHPLTVLRPRISRVPLIQIRRGTSKGDHSTIWISEKLISLAFVGVFPVVLIWPNPFTDYVLAASLAFHHYVGIEAVLTDYARPSVIGKTLSAICKYSNVAMTFVVLYGLIMFTRNDMLYGNAVKLLWSLDTKCRSRRV